MGDKGFSETHPQAQVLGVGYDRTLGGGELNFRVREFLADKFNALKKTKTDVKTVPRAMGKLLKESERVKLILSANTDCFAQIENVMEDIDFKEPMSRDKLLELGADLFPRVTTPVQTALETAGMAMENIDQVTLVGGGTRIPKVQELLTEFVGQELGKSLNTDESAAMGAVYKAADLSTGFKVKKFLTKDAVVFPIDVDFSRAIESEEGGEAGFKKVKRTLFGRMNPFPQKKIMTFNKHQADFTFFVNHGDLDYLGEEVKNIGSLNITSVLVKGVKEALEANKGDNIETKGVKAHFQMDDSGILTVSNVESTFEKTVSPEEQEKLEKEEDKEADDSIDWSKLGDTISNYFNSEKKDGETDAEKEKAKDWIKDTIKNSEKEKKEKDKKEKKDKKDKKDDKPKEPKKPLVETLKTELTMEGSRLDLQPLEGESFDVSKTKLDALKKADQDRFAKETALNELQSFSFDLGMKMEEDEYVQASVESERESITSEVGKVSDWLDEEADLTTPIEDFNSRLKVLKDLAAPIFARVREHRERPEALENLKTSLNNSHNFLTKSKENTEKTGGEEGLFKEKELEMLEKKIADVEKWRDEKLAEQEATPLSEMPKMTVSMINMKVGDLESEIQYLIQKAKMKKAELDRAKRKAEEEAAKAEAARKKAEKKEKKKKAKEANDTGSTDESSDEESPPTESSPPGGDDTNKEPTEEKPESIVEPTEEKLDTKEEDAEHIEL